MSPILPLFISLLGGKKEELCSRQSNLMCSVTASAAGKAPSVSRPHRRKSTPKCKIRQPVPVDSSHSGMSSPGEGPQFIDEATYLAKPAVKEETSKALDLSDKSSSYAYTFEERVDEATYTNGLVGGTLPGFVYEEAAMKPEYNESEFTALESKGFKNEWMEEKIDLSTNPIGKIEKNELDSHDEYGTDSSALASINDISSQLSAAVAVFSQSGLGGIKPNTQRSVNRRKSRRAPVKVEKKSILSTSFADYSCPIAMSINNNEVPNDVHESLTSCHEMTNKRSGNSLLSINSPVRTQRSRKGLDFSDMKSAFEEIGNMAKCLICNKILANKNNRTFHWRSHVGDKRYSCDICQKAFTHPSNMRSHRKIHTDEKPFPCDQCDRRFRRRDYLLQHLQRFHHNPKSTADSDLPPENSLSAQGSESNSN